MSLKITICAFFGNMLFCIADPMIKIYVKLKCKIRRLIKNVKTRYTRADEEHLIEH